ncbi:MAG: histidinol dehydrogenase [Armatimonadetes bacterium]|nr:histidinol dehydrogenase [Armatimonadota bacterium]
MNVVHLREVPPQRLRRVLDRSRADVFDAQRQREMAALLDDVARRGDEAVVEATARFDGAAVPVDRLLVSPKELRDARDAIDDGVAAALRQSILRARRYHEWLRPRELSIEELEPGLRAGVRFSPVASVGAYVPAGKGSFPSTVATMITPAVVAGVPEISVVVPPRPDGTVDPAVLYAVDQLGLDRVYRANGPAAIAALAVGTATFPRVDTIVGPGNPYVAAMQIQAQTRGVRMLAMLGPTEALVLADADAAPDLVALDLLAEAEHGSDSASLLVTPSGALAAAVADRLADLLSKLPEPRRTYARDALTNLGGLFVTDELDEAIAFANAYAAEHVMLHLRDPWAVASRIVHAGEILVGPHATFSTGNYAIGVPACLPTGGAARRDGGVTVLTFLKATSIAALDREALVRLRPVVENLGRYEGFPAHVMAVRDRPGTVSGGS